MAVQSSECAAVGAVASPTHWLGRAGALAELVKPRLTALAVMSALVGYWLAAGGAVNPPVLTAVLIGAWLVGGGANALNQYMERHLDARMRRTAGRPLPSGRLEPEEARCFGAVLTCAGIGFLTIRTNALTGFLALLIALSYLFIYTPLKRASPWSTVVGTVPGALPMLMGWTASGRPVNSAAWALFALVALWQLPHFLAIGWLYRDEYYGAGFNIWPVRDPGGRRMGVASTLLCVLLVPLSMVPAWTGLAGQLYVGFAAAGGVAFAGVALAWAWAPSVRTARAVFRASILYLPFLMLVMVLDQP